MCYLSYNVRDICLLLGYCCVYMHMIYDPMALIELERSDSMSYIFDTFNTSPKCAALKNMLPFCCVHFFVVV